MSEDIKIVERPEVHCLEIARDVRMWTIAKNLGECFPRMKAHIENTGGTPTGAPYAQYLNVDWAGVRTNGPLKMMWQLLTQKIPMRIGFPAPPGTRGSGDIEASIQPAGKYVSAKHFGPYHKVGELYKRIAIWAADNDVTLEDKSFEYYVNDPTLVKPEEIETEVWVPVV